MYFFLFHIQKIITEYYIMSELKDDVVEQNSELTELEQERKEEVLVTEEVTIVEEEPIVEQPIVEETNISSPEESDIKPKLPKKSNYFKRFFKFFNW